MKKKLISLLMAICLIVGLLPVMATADDANTATVLVAGVELTVTEGGAAAYTKNAEATYYAEAEATTSFTGWKQVKADDTDRLHWMATITVTLDNGDVLEYEFFYYDTRRCFYTVNGEGQFYVYRDHLDKVLRDTDRVIKGLPVDWQGKN